MKTKSGEVITGWGDDSVMVDSNGAQWVYAPDQFVGHKWVELTPESVMIMLEGVLYTRDTLEEIVETHSYTNHDEVALYDRTFIRRNDGSHWMENR